MSNHTPGPWAVDADAYPIMVYSESETWPLVDELGNEEGYKGAFIANTGDNAANARLIAAAPELLDALHALESFYPSTEEMELSDDYSVSEIDWVELARAAIAKATGAA